MPITVGFPPWLRGEESSCDAGYTGQWVLSLGGEDPLEEDMETHSSILAWESPWTEEPGGLQSIWSQKVREDSGN